MSTRSSSAFLERRTAEPAASAVAEIQPGGFLLALDRNWLITHVSANIGDHFADFGGSMAGQPLAEFFGAQAVHSLRNQLALRRDANGAARLFSVLFAGFPKPFDVAIHGDGGGILLEAFPAAHSEAGDPVGTVRELATRLDGHATLPALLDEAAHQLRALTGFDRVTIFRQSGDHAAESVAHDARGVHPPARPPSQPSAGARLIGDADAACARIVPEAGPGLLEESILRAPSQDERDVLRANCARASLSLPLRFGDTAWGVALCLDQSPRRPLLDRLAAAELFADLLAMRIEICELRNSTLGED